MSATTKFKPCLKQATEEPPARGGFPLCPVLTGSYPQNGRSKKRQEKPMNVPHFQSGLIASTVFTEFPVTLLVNVILSASEAATQPRKLSGRGQAFNLKIVF